MVEQMQKEHAPARQPYRQTDDCRFVLVRQSPIAAQNPKLLSRLGEIGQLACLPTRPNPGH
jgi:hypothetical protein